MKPHVMATTSDSPVAANAGSPPMAMRQPPKYLGRRWSLGQAGVAHLVVCGLIFAAGVKTQANLLFWGFGLMVGAMVVSVIWNWLVMRRVELLRLLPDHAVAGQELTLRYRVVSRQKWLAIFNLVIEEVSPVLSPSAGKRRRWSLFRSAAKRPPFSGVLAQSPLGWIVHLGPKQTAQAQATSWPLKRGRLVLGPMRLSSSFPFGIVRCTLDFDQPDYVLIYPELHRMNRNVWHRLTTIDPAGHLLVDRAGGAEEFFGLRRYRTGDSLRSIDWRHSAKTGQLISREMTQPSPPRVMIRLDLTVSPFESSQSGSAVGIGGSVARNSGGNRGENRGGWLWLKVMTGLANESDYRRWDQIQSRGRSPTANFTPQQLQERAVALTASLICGAHLQGYQVGLVVVGGSPVTIRAHHSLPHRSRLLEALSLVQTPSGDDAGTLAAAGVGGGATVVVTAGPHISRAMLGKAMHLSADQLEDYVKPTQDHWQLLARSVQPAARHRRLVRMSSPLAGEGRAS